MKEIVISHSFKDEELAHAVCRVLEKNGFSCWIAPRDVTFGHTYASDITVAIRGKAKIVLVIVSINSTCSHHVINELSVATSSRKYLLPFQIDTSDWSDEFVYYLDSSHRIDASSNPPEFFPELVSAVGTLLEKDLSLAPVENFRDEEYEKQINFENLRRKTQEQRQAFVNSIDPDTEEEIDRSHYYEKIVRLDVVDSKKDLWSSYRFLTITNVSDNNTDFIVHKECGENKTAFKKMRVRAHINDPNGDKLVVKSMTAIQPNFVQVFKINFKKPLRPKETLTIFYRLEWRNEPDAYYMGELSQSISLVRYPRGVGTLEFAVFEPYPIVNSSIKAIDQLYNEQKCNAYPKYLSVQEEEKLSPLHEKKLFGVKYVTENAIGASSYVIIYQLDDTDDKPEEDDFF